VTVNEQVFPPKTLKKLIGTDPVGISHKINPTAEIWTRKIRM